MQQDGRFSRCLDACDLAETRSFCPRQLPAVAASCEHQAEGHRKPLNHGEVEPLSLGVRNLAR